MMKTLSSTIVALAVVGAMVGGAQEAHAQFGNPFQRAERSIRTELGRASRSVQRAHAMNYQVRVTNPTSRTIFYRFEGAPQALPAHTVRTHRGSKIGRPTVSFGNGRRQTVQYGLDGNRSFAFEWKNGVLDLYRR